MLVAILYTGKSTMIESTIQQFKKIVLHYHVFGVINSDNVDSDNHMIRDTLGDNVKSLTWFDDGNREWITLRDTLLKRIDIDENWLAFLRNSGSMVEYYQLYLGYQALEMYEKEHGIRYDYVMRFRTDCVLKDAIDFEKIFEKEYVANMLATIKSKMKIDTSEQLLNVFMNTFYNPKRLLYNVDYEERNNSIYKLLELDSLIDNLVDYLKHGNYVVRLRKNILYFMRRDVMTHIHLLGISYGEYKNNNVFWFNAESQLDNICTTYNIDAFNSTTDLEHKSIYAYHHENYETDGEYSFFIIRYI